MSGCQGVPAATRSPLTPSETAEVRTGTCRPLISSWSCDTVSPTRQQRLAFTPEADRGAWDERPLVVPTDMVTVARRLRHFVRATTEPDQLIHGDLSGNVLFSVEHEPAIIDMPPYWRPVSYAEGIVVADALLTWHESDELIELTQVARSDVARRGTLQPRRPCAPARCVGARRPAGPLCPSR